MSLLPSIPVSIKDELISACALGWAVVGALSLLILLAALCFAGHRWTVTYNLSRIGKWCGFVAAVFAFNASIFVAAFGGYSDELEFTNVLLVPVFTCAIPWAGIGLQIWSRRMMLQDLPKANALKRL